MILFRLAFSFRRGYVVSWWSWWDYQKEAIIFRLIGEEGDEIICGVTQVAINDHFHTADTEQDAKDNFDDNTDFIVSIAANLIDEDGVYLITSDHM